MVQFATVEIASPSRLTIFQNSSCSGESLGGLALAVRGSWNVAALTLILPQNTCDCRRWWTGSLADINDIYVYMQKGSMAGISPFCSATLTLVWALYPPKDSSLDFSQLALRQHPSASYAWFWFSNLMLFCASRLTKQGVNRLHISLPRQTPAPFHSMQLSYCDQVQGWVQPAQSPGEMHLPPNGSTSSQTTRRSHPKDPTSAGSLCRPCLDLRQLHHYVRYRIIPFPYQVNRMTRTGQNIQKHALVEEASNIRLEYTKPKSPFLQVSESFLGLQQAAQACTARSATSKQQAVHLRRVPQPSSY